MVVGVDSFDAVLDRMSNERAEASSHGSGHWTAMRGWNSSFVATSLRSQPWPSREQRGTADPAVHIDASTSAPRPKPAVHNAAPTPPPKPKPDIDTSLYKRLSPEDVAKDINLLATDTPAELKSKRRRFARLNHPDRTPMEWREAATIRMKIANHMVDEALRGKLAARA
ncbi:hypothetical protein [Hoeflea sp. EC-HK425]|uniref:hypothetical protein n=1 Tax=Hoeflea sp. EC-HK425 TaxID=2038388 RepID=UPI0012514FF1|nr:hypothetical protein [Hoeflea sp. EC-HK425]VVT04098.1 conserved hypothetical protein [Hoeflea sp. EC-HK425]